MTEKKQMHSVLSETENAVSPQDYRDAMSHFAAAVHLVTTDGLAGRRGVTISACCSLSDNPPTILLCLMRQREENRYFIENRHFCLNTLAGHHIKLSDAFSGRGNLTSNERFSLAEWKTLQTGAPALTDSLASFDCELVESFEHATHYILIGRVVAISRHQADSALTYLNRKYHMLPL